MEDGIVLEFLEISFISQVVENGELTELIR